MVQRIGGTRRKTRHKFSKSLREKGKLSLKSFFQRFKIGDNVLLHAEPAHQGGMYYRRFHGKSGVVEGSQGACYYVAIKDNRVKKSVLVHRVHLRKI